MNLNLQIPTDTLMISRSELKNVLREMLEEIQTEKVQDDIFTIQEAAIYMKVSVPTIRNMIANNEIPHFKRGQVIRLNRWEILEWIKTHNEEGVK